MENNQKDSHPSPPKPGQLVRPGPISHAFGLDDSLQDLYPTVPSSATGRLVRVRPGSANKSTGLHSAQQDPSSSSSLPSQFIQTGLTSSQKSLVPERNQQGKGPKHWYKRQKRETRIGIWFALVMLLFIAALGMIAAATTSQPDASTSTHRVTPAQTIPTFTPTPTSTEKVINSAPIRNATPEPLDTPTVEDAVTPTPINVSP